MESKIAFSTYITLILRNPKILLLTLRRLYIMRFSEEFKREKQLDIKTKIIDKTGFDEVMAVDDNAMSGENSQYNQIKDSIQYRGNR